MELNYKGVSVLTKRLPTLRRNQLLKKFKHRFVSYKDWLSSENPTVTGGEALVLWTADFLAAAGTLSQAQQDLIFNSEIGDSLLKFGTLLSDAYFGQDQIPIGHLCVVNRSFVAITKVATRTDETASDYLDLNTGDMVDYAATFKDLPVEITTYNLTSLFTVRIMAYSRLKKLEKPGEKHAAHSLN